MKVYDAATIRNVAIVGHGGCGKTQLFRPCSSPPAPSTGSARVDDGTTVTDFDDEEIARKHTLSSSLAHAEWQKTKINIIDTPGFANFLTDARAALRVVEAAVVVVDAVARRRGADREALGRSRRRSTCRASSSLNRLDRERASLERSLESLHRDCAREIVPIQLPIGEEKAFHRRRRPGAHEGPDLCRRRQRRDDRRRDPRRHRRPRRGRRATALIEMVAEADEALMEAFFAEGTLTQEQLVAGPAHRDDGRRSSSRWSARPALTSSASSRCSTRSSATCPSPPSGRSRRLDTDGTELAVTPADTRRTPRSSGRPSPTRSPAASRCCASSTARSSRTRPCTTSPATRRSGSATCWRCRARRRRTCPELKAGDLGAVAKLKDTHTNDVLAESSVKYRVAPITFPEPVLVLRDRAEEPRRRGQDQHVDAAAAGGRPDASATRATRRPTSCCSPARASCTSR